MRDLQVMVPYSDSSDLCKHCLASAWRSVHENIAIDSSIRPRVDGGAGKSTQLALKLRLRE